MSNLQWCPTHLHSDASLLDGLSNVKDIANRCAELGYSSCALTDHGNLSNSIKFHSAMSKKGIKPILGSELYICDDDCKIITKENKHKHHLCVLAKNLEGWKSLLWITSISNNYFYYRPRVDLQTIKKYANGNLIAFSGHLGSELANVLYDRATGTIYSDAEDRAIACVNKYIDTFGRENFFIEIQLIDKHNVQLASVISDILRSVAIKTGVRCVATADSHYVRKADAILQRILLATSLRTNFKKVYTALAQEEEVGLSTFFISDNYHIPSIEELLDVGSTEAEIETAYEIGEMCQKYEVTNKPSFPKFEGVDDEFEYLTQLCRNGWRSKISGIIPKDKIPIYTDRIKQELQIIKEANLSGYFLIVSDYVNWAKQRMLVGPGRGSGGGCMISYLTGITEIDPIPYDLMFSRFYNAGRNTADRVSLPDIDCDFPISKRAEVIQYIRSKYGDGCVAQICTFGRMQGRSALKDVLNAYSACSFKEMNEITEFIPDEAEISDQLQEMVEEEGSSSIIKWALEHNSKQLSKWCVLEDDGTFSGDYATYFQQAIALEGTKRSMGKHAAGIVITQQQAEKVCPMVRTSGSKELIAGWEMNDLEATGQVKFDILGVASLDKLMGVKNALRGQPIWEEVR